MAPPVSRRGLPKGEWVVDASVTMAWFFEDEATPWTEALLDALGGRTIWAPSLWVIECTNVLQSARRRRRIDAERRAEIAGQLAELPVRIDVERPDFVRLDRLCEMHALTAYDATYLELAVRRGTALVSLDQRLVEAARSVGLAVAPR